jgi:hypothetical protein
VERPGELPQFHHWFKGERDIARLESLDPLDNVLRKRELRFYEQIRAIADQYEIRFGSDIAFQPLRSAVLTTFSEGPFSIACMIAGMDNVAMWCLTDPPLVRRMVDLITGKEIERITRQFQFMGMPPGELALADDFSPYMSEDIYTDLILPSQLRLRDAFGERVHFHSCIPDRRLLPYWKEQLNIRHFNGFKPQGGFAAIKRDYSPVAELMGNTITMEPDIDGINTLGASEAELKAAALDMHAVFGNYKGVRLCATLSGAHRTDDLKKMNVLKATIVSKG